MRAIRVEEQLDAEVNVRVVAANTDHLASLLQGGRGGIWRSGHCSPEDRHLERAEEQKKKGERVGDEGSRRLAGALMGEVGS